jgi:5-(carboxyamino)imidazole ribonucleotide synthase
MMAIEARRLAFNVVVLDPKANCAASQVTNTTIVGNLSDVDALRALSAQCDRITLDTEHVDAAALQAGTRPDQVFPTPDIMATVQDRLVQKQFLTGIGVPQTQYADIHSLEGLTRDATLFGFPAIVKSRKGGYDGRGQYRIESQADLATIHAKIGNIPSVLEKRVVFEKEFSVLLARNAGGQVRHFPIAENIHRHHILHMTLVPADVSPQAITRSNEIATAIAEAWQYVGVLVIEFFLTTTGEVLVNEIAPRVHNSGHYSWGGCRTSQFEQHVRAIAGLPLGDPSLLRPGVMVNLLGDLWNKGEPDWQSVLRNDDVDLHLYGKGQGWPGRKMGHLVVYGPTVDRAAARAEAVFGALQAASL